MCGCYPTAITVEAHLCASVFMRVTDSERLCVCKSDVLMYSSIYVRCILMADNQGIINIQILSVKGILWDICNLSI